MATRALSSIRLRPMSQDDVPQVMEIERASFPTIWPQTAYRRELQNPAARYFVIVEEGEGEGGGGAGQPGRWLGALRRMVGVETAGTGGVLLGFIGMWLLVGEVHIVTLAVRDDRRRRGIGERLLIQCIETAIEYDQEVVTLEVRKSNEAAQRLYGKYGFERAGLRVRYYTDNGEDAVIMTTPEVATPGFRALFESLRRRHQELRPELW